MSNNQRNVILTLILLSGFFLCTCPVFVGLGFLFGPRTIRQHERESAEMLNERIDRVAEDRELHDEYRIRKKYGR